jgi:hypothetical protein
MMDAFIDEDEVLLSTDADRSATLHVGIENLSSRSEHLVVQERAFSYGGWRIANASGYKDAAMYYTTRLLLSAHQSGRMHRSESEEPVAFFRNTLWSLRETWEVFSYNCTCKHESDHTEKDGKSKIFPYARITKHFWTLHRRFTVEQYLCDGTLRELWHIAPRYWFFALLHLDLRDPQSRQLLGRIDEKWSVVRRTLDAKLASGEDKTLFSLAVVLAAFNKGGSGGNSGSSGGGGGGALRGGGASAR